MIEIKPKRVLSFVMILALVLSFIVVLPATSQNKDTIVPKLEELRGKVENEHPSLKNKVEAVIHQIRAGAMNGALNKLENDVKKSILQWVENPEELIELIDEIINLIKCKLPHPPTPDFRISANPTTLKIPKGNSDTSTITVTSVSNFSQEIALTSSTTATSGVSLSLSPSVLTPPANESVTSTLHVDVASTINTGQYSITVTGTNGSLQHSVKITLEVIMLPPPPPKPDFTISASPNSLIITQGDSNISVITMTSVEGFSKPVKLNVTSQPINGMTTTLTPMQVIPPHDGYAISVLSIDVADTVTRGNYNITVTGTSKLLIHSANVSLEIIPPPPPPAVEDFSLISVPTELTIAQGDYATSAIVVISYKGFNEQVSLVAASEGLTGISLSLSPAQVTPPAGGFATATLRVDIASDAEIGESEVTITGTSGALQHTSKLSVNVVASQPPPPTPDFSITATPSALAVPQGDSDFSVITISSLKSFSQPVNLTVTSAPVEGVTAAITPSQVVPAANALTIAILRIDITSDAPVGLHEITVAGKSGLITHDTDIAIEIIATPSPPAPDFIIMIIPESLTVEQGDSATSNVIVVSREGFSQPVDLSIGVMLSGITAATDPSQVTPTSDGFTTSTVKITAALTVDLGDHELTITGISGALTRSARLFLKVSLETKPPIIKGVQNAPQQPSYDETVTVSALVSDVESGISKAILEYRHEASSFNVTMVFLGAFEVCMATIPAFPFNSSVHYTVYAMDEAGNWAKSSAFSYRPVDPYAPMIEKLTGSPLEPAAYEEITVNVTVTEPADASGVDRVDLWYVNKTLESWQSVSMTLKDGNWTAIIANQSDTDLGFFVEAFDKAGNYARSEIQIRKVAAPSGLPLAWVLAAIVAIAVIIGGTAYYTRVKKKRGASVAPTST